MRMWIMSAGLNGALAVALGAYAAHGLEAAPGQHGVFRTAVDFQMWHALALLGTVRLRGYVRSGARVWLMHLAGALFTVGIVLFSGSLYAIGLTGDTLFPMAAPLGGVLLIGGWLALLAWALIPTPRS